MTSTRSALFLVVALFLCAGILTVAVGPTAVLADPTGGGDGGPAKPP